MLPPEILDQVNSLNLHHRELVSIINRLSRPSEITDQLVLDEVVGRVKAGFVKSDRDIEVCYPQARLYLIY
jgi:hypothetical protein